MRLQARLERIGEDRHWGDLYKKINTPDITRQTSTFRDSVSGTAPGSGE